MVMHMAARVAGTWAPFSPGFRTSEPASNPWSYFHGSPPRLLPQASEAWGLGGWGLGMFSPREEPQIQPNPLLNRRAKGPSVCLAGGKRSRARVRTLSALPIQTLICFWYLCPSPQPPPLPGGEALPPQASPPDGPRLGLSTGRPHLLPAPLPVVVATKPHGSPHFSSPDHGPQVSLTCHVRPPGLGVSR